MCHASNKQPAHVNVSTQPTSTTQENTPYAVTTEDFWGPRQARQQRQKREPQIQERYMISFVRRNPHAHAFFGGACLLVVPAQLPFIPARSSLGKCTTTTTTTPPQQARHKDLKEGVHRHPWHPTHRRDRLLAANTTPGTNPRLTTNAQRYELLRAIRGSAIDTAFATTTSTPGMSCHDQAARFQYGAQPPARRRHTVGGRRAKHGRVCSFPKQKNMVVLGEKKKKKKWVVRGLPCSPHPRRQDPAL